MNFLRFFLLFSVILFILGCNSGEKADLIIINGNFFTIDPAFEGAEGIAIKDGHIYSIGTTEEILSLKAEVTQLIDAGGRFVMPGFIEGHGHFSSLGKMKRILDMKGTQSWSEIINMVGEKAKSIPEGTWIEGRGWHQEKWAQPAEGAIGGYPVHQKLSNVSPKHPVLLRHASGHALFANQAAMALAGINKGTQSPEGGNILKDEDGKPTGIFEETAMDLISQVFDSVNNALPDAKLQALWESDVQLATQVCLENGITSFHDAGAGLDEVGRYKQLVEEGKLGIRLYTMILDSLSNMESQGKDLPIINYKGQNMLTVRAIKMYADGALGSYGAWLLHPYADRPEFTGQIVTPPKQIRKVADFAINAGLQLCIHAIGDRGNREVLDIYEQTFDRHPGKKDIRWRVEHAQHLDTTDIPRFAQLGVVPSMQAVHCTSDAPFVVKRLGEERARQGAYVWRKLIESGARIANGTDTPVEDINPIDCFYAAVTRKRKDGVVFFPDMKMERKEALEAYTINNAYASFEEDLKGSLSPGKLADIIILSNDLEKVEADQIPNTKVLCTIIGGEVRYKHPDF